MPILPEDGIAIRTGLMCRVSRRKLLMGKMQHAAMMTLLTLVRRDKIFGGRPTNHVDKTLSNNTLHRFVWPIPTKI